MGSTNQAPFYDIDHLRKMSVARCVETSPVRYSILRSRAPRFTASSNDVPFGAYNTDTAHKKSVESHCRDNRRFYASSFESTVPRFGRPWSTPSVDAFYDPSKCQNSKPNSIEAALDSTAIEYAIHRSKYKRFQDRNRSEGPDVVYDVDAGNKMSLAKHMLESPIRYRNVGSPTDAQYARSRSSDFRLRLSPGMYDAKIAADICVSPALDNRPMSSLVSRTPRFGRGTFAGYGLGSTYRPENDTKKWLERDMTISKADYLRPQYLPKSYAHGGHPQSAPPRPSVAVDK